MILSSCNIAQVLNNQLIVFNYGSNLHWEGVLAFRQFIAHSFSLAASARRLSSDWHSTPLFTVLYETASVPPAPVPPLFHKKISFSFASKSLLLLSASIHVNDIQKINEIETSSTKMLHSFCSLLPSLIPEFIVIPSAVDTTCDMNELVNN